MPAKDIAWVTADFIDSMVHDGLWDIYNDYHMGLTGENVAEKYNITRKSRTSSPLTRTAKPSPRKKKDASRRRLFP